MLASVQALLLQELQWPSDGREPAPLKELTHEEILQALCSTMATVLHQIADNAGHSCAHVVLRGPPTDGTSAPLFNVTNSADFYRFCRPRVVSCRSPADTVNQLCSHVDEFTSPGGIAQFLFSVLLTCGLDRVRSAMHGIASLLYDDASSDQLLVNLLITGMPIEEVCLFPSVCVCVCVQFCGCACVCVCVWLLMPRSFLLGWLLLQIEENAWASWQGLNRVGFIPAQRLYVPASRFLNPLYPVWVCHGALSRVQQQRSKKKKA